jgi:very-short-patch-repair endonuclease
LAVATVFATRRDTRYGEQTGRDACRDRQLAELGWLVLRFWNDDVIRDIDAVCLHIVASAGLVAEDVARQIEFPTQEAHP